MKKIMFNLSKKQRSAGRTFKDNRDREYYNELGHPEKNEEGEFEYFEDELWAYDGHDLLTKPSARKITHFKWLGNACSNFWKGRFDSRSNLVSIVPPESTLLGFYSKGPKPPENLIYQIHQKYPGAMIIPTKDVSMSAYSSSKNWYKKSGCR